ncbi:HNH endonuclease [Micromonospora sp. PLK6-60]|uniref:HNH endonuclease n=1 Tax=Micromonospora sp. PLK6-60 TaxID=2873383 RepID=UPI0035AC0AC7
MVSSRCAPNRGRKISRETVVRLIAAGAGYCYKPACPIGSLWHELEDGRAVKLAEVAHIVAAGEGGPRSDVEATEAELTSFQNLILLCPNCHSIVDAAPSLYPVSLLKEWKDSHEARVREILGIQTYGTRAELRRSLDPYLSENRQIWETYGPDSEAANRTLFSDVSAAWRREVVARVLPNNARMLRLLEANQALLNEQERPVVTRLRMHVRSMEDRHLGGIINPAAPRFPIELNNLLRD